MLNKILSYSSACFVHIFERSTSLYTVTSYLSYFLLYLENLYKQVLSGPMQRLIMILELSILKDI